MHDTSCLFSIVKNTNGSTKVYSFLPPHGRTLDANEEYTIFGHVQEAMIRNGDRATSQRWFQALENAIARGDLQIVKTPAVILESPNGSLYTLSVANGGALSTVSPCFEGSSSLQLTPD